jgi:hypothetical protein
MKTQLEEVKVTPDTITLPSGIFLTPDGKVYVKPEKPEKKIPKKRLPGTVFLTPCPFM